MADRFLSIPEFRVGLPPVVAAVLVLGAVARFAVFNAGTLLPLMVAEKTVADQPITPTLAERPTRSVSLFDPTADRSFDAPSTPLIAWEAEAGSKDAWPIVLAAHPVEAGASPLAATDGDRGGTVIRLLETRAVDADRVTTEAIERASRELERHDLDPARFESIQYFERDRCVPCTAG